MKKVILVLLTIVITLFITGCSQDISSNQSSMEDISSSQSLLEDISSISSSADADGIFINDKLTKYKDITYSDFKEKYKQQAELLHGCFYFAPLVDENLYIVFMSEKIDEELLTPILTDTDKVARLEGALGSIINGLNKELSVEDFVDKLAVNFKTKPLYHFEEGAGTAYYVANKYIVVELDTDNDEKNDTIIEISLDENKNISADSYAWLIWEIY